MRLDEFKQERVGDRIRWTAALTDDRGDQAYQLLLVGAEGQVKEVFGESEFEVTISPDSEHEEMTARASQLIGRSESVLPQDAFDDLSSLFRDDAPKPSADDSVICAIRRERPGGTGFALIVPLVVPTGVNVFFPFPLAFVCGGAVLPVTGDPDLFLHVNSVVAPPVLRSTFSAGPDSLRFATPPFAQFFPIFRVFGFASSIATFTGASFGLP